MSNSYFNHTNRFVKLDTVRAEDVNAVFDSVSSGLDGVQIKTNAALKLPDGETSVTLPAPAARVGRLLGFNAVTGLPETQTLIGENKGDWTTGTSYGLRDIVKDAATTKNIYQCIVEHTSGTLSTDVSSGKWRLLVDAVSATNSANAAAQSVVDATAQVALAAGQVSLATVQANNALTSATNAKASENMIYGGLNFKGPWSSLSGPLNTPASVLHNNQYWVLLSNLANVAANEPGISSVWVLPGDGFNRVGRIQFLASSF